MNKKVLWITRTGIFIALLVVAQVVSSAFGNTIVTGSIVNLILIIATMLCGVSVGTCVAVLSPIFAKLIGIGPLWSLIPFIILGNIAITLVWTLVTRKKNGKKMITYITACVLGAVTKFIVLYLGVVQIAVPILLKLPEPQASAISAIFSVPQLFTALIGGGIAVIILPMLMQATQKK